MEDEKWYDVYDIRKELIKKDIDLKIGEEAYYQYLEHGYEFDFVKFRWKKVNNGI